MCAMELVAWIAGERHTSSPAGACPLLTSMVQGLNDGFEDSERQRLIEYALPLAHSLADRNEESQRAQLAAAWLKHEYPSYRHAEGAPFVALAVAMAAEWEEPGWADKAFTDLERDIAVGLRPETDEEAATLEGSGDRVEMLESVFALLDRMLATPTPESLDGEDGAAGAVVPVG